MIGHWEGVTVVKKTGSSCLITLTDRHSRYLLAKKITTKIQSMDALLEKNTGAVLDLKIFLTRD